MSAVTSRVASRSQYEYPTKYPGTYDRVVVSRTDAALDSYPRSTRAKTTAQKIFMGCCSGGYNRPQRTSSDGRPDPRPR